MKKLILSSLALSTLLLAAEQPYELSFTAGGTIPESDLKLDNHKNYGIRFGFDNNYILEKYFNKLELSYEQSKDVIYEGTSLKADSIKRYGINLIHQYTTKEKMTPYALVGIGLEDFKKQYQQINDGVTANLGAGIKYAISDNWNIRTEIRDQINLEQEIAHNLIYTVGLGYSFGQKAVKEAPKKETITKIEKPKTIIKEEPKQVIKKAAPVIIEKDSDGDGVLDKNDKCPNTLNGFNVDTKGCPLDINLNVQFDTDKSNVKPIYNDRLNKFVNFMNMMPNYKAKIQGHTDSVGTAAYNMKLSERRAKSVMDKLNELGIKKTRLSFEGFGLTKPVASNSTKEGRALNRRVEAIIIK